MSALSSLPLSVWLRLEGVFAFFVVLLQFHAFARRRPEGGRRTMVVKLAVYYLIVHLVLLLIDLGGRWLHGLLLLVGLSACRELAAALLPPQPGSRLYRAVAAAGTLVALVLAAQAGAVEPLVMAVLLIGLAIPVLARAPSAAHARLAALLTIVMIAGVLPRYLLTLRTDYGGAAAFLYLIVVLNDGFAEAFGRLFGRNPFFAAVSPNKTVEGAVFGFLASLVGALLFQSLLPGTRVQAVGLAALVSLSGNLGDLVFSAIKRSVGQKDFDSVLPATGGILDRFDSLLYSAPIFYVALGLLSPR